MRNDRIYFPSGWCQMDCERWLTANRPELPWDLIERCDGTPGYIWIRLNWWGWPSR